MDPMVSKVLLIINLVMWGFLAFTVLINFLRGRRKSTIHLIVSTLLIIASFILAFPLSKLAGKIKINGQDVIQFIASQIEGIEIKEGSVLEEYIHALISAFLRLPVYYVLLLINMLIIRPILKAIAKAIFMNRETRTLDKRIGSRGIGALIGVVTFFVVFFAWFSPVLGLEGIAEEALVYKDEIVEVQNNNGEAAEEENTLDQVQLYVDAFNNGSFFKIVTVLSGKNHRLHIMTLSNLVSIRTSNGNIKIKNELDALLPIASVAMQVDDQKDILPVVIANKEMVIKAMRSSELFNVAMPLVVEMTEDKLTELEIDVEKLKAINWKNEKNNLIDIVSASIDFCETTELDLDKPMEALKNTKLPDALSKIGTTIDKSALIKDVLLAFGNKYLQDALKEKMPAELDVLLKIADLTKLNLQNDFYIFGQLINDLATTGLIDGTEEFNVINNRVQIKNIIERAFQISTVRGNEQELIEQLLAYTHMDEKLSEAGVTLHYENILWRTEIALLSDTVYQLLDLLAEKGYTSLDGVDFLTLIKENAASPQVRAALDDICSSKLMQTSLLTIIDKALDSASLSNWKSSYFIALVNGDETATPEELKTELLSLLDMISEVLKLSSTDFSNLNVNSISDDDLSILQNILVMMNNSKLINIDALTDTLNSFISGFEYNITINSITDENDSGTNKDEWAEEIPLIINLIKSIRDLGSIEADALTSHTAELGKLLNDMKATRSFGGAAFDNLAYEIFNKTGLIENEDHPNGFIKDEAARTASWHIYDYEAELAIISGYDTTKQPEEQTEFFETLRQSQIFNDLIDINAITKRIIGDASVTVHGNTYMLKDYINVSKDDLEGRSWSDEMDAIKELTDICSSETETELLSRLEAFSEGETLAADSAKALLDDINND